MRDVLDLSSGFAHFPSKVFPFGVFSFSLWVVHLSEKNLVEGTMQSISTKTVHLR